MESAIFVAWEGYGENIQEGNQGDRITCSQGESMLAKEHK